MTPIEWFYAKGDKHSGPVNSVELKRLATAGELKPDDLVWREGMAEWTVARNVRGLFDEEAKPANAAAGAPPKLIDPVPMPAAATAPTATSTTFAPTTAPLAKKTPRPAKHLFDLFLDFVRSQFTAAFVESTTRLFVTVGKFGLYAAMALTLLFSLLVALKTHDFEAVLWGIIYFLIFAALQYIGVRFCETLDRLNRNTSATVSSTLFWIASALLSIATSASVLIGCLVLAIASKELGWIVPGLAGFIVCQYLAFIALNPSTINVSIAPESRAGEEAIGVISFLFKAILKLVPVIFGTFAVLGSVLLLYASVEIFTSSGPILAQIIAENAWRALQCSSTLPFVTYLIFLLIYLVLDICRAILVMPGKLDNLQDREAKVAKRDGLRSDFRIGHSRAVLSTPQAAFVIHHSYFLLHPSSPPQHNPAVLDVIRDDLLGAGAAAMFRDVHGAAELRAVADFAEVDDGVRVREHVAFDERAFDQPVQRRLVRGDQQHAADLCRIVNVPGDRRGVGPIMFAEQVAARPTRRLCGESGDRCTRTIRTAPNRSADRPARCHRRPPAPHPARNCRRKTRSWRLAAGPTRPANRASRRNPSRPA